MSHFSVMVIGEDQENQLSLFDIDLELPQYVAYTKQQLIEKERKRIEDYKNGTYAGYLKDKDAYRENCINKQHLNYIENIFPKMLEFTDEQLYEEAIKFYESKEIGPEGEVYSTSNPNSKWDWYKVGGRWAGLLKLKEGIQPIASPNFSWNWPVEEIHKVLSENRADIALKKDIENIDEIVCYALIKDSKWYQRGEMGPWTIETNVNADWDNEFKKLVKELPDDTLITIVDCHT